MRASLMIGAAVAAAMACGTPGIASAEDGYEGQTYAEASEALSKAGMTSRVGTVTGDTLPTAECLVTGSRSEPVLGASGATGESRVILDLDCGTSTAAPEQPEQPAASGTQTDTGGQSTMEQQSPGANG